MRRAFVAGLVSAVGVVVYCGAQAAHAEDKKGLSWGGDFRYRHELVSQEGAVIPSTQQQRIRARIAAKAAVNETTEFEVRLATANGRTSTNQTLGASANAFANYTIGLDRANFRWKPSELFSLSGGRAGNPYFLAGESDLVWDTDLNFDGLSFSVSPAMGDFTPFVTGNLFWVDKATSAAVKDVLLTSLQAGVRHKLGGDMSWAAGVVLHHYSHLAGHALINAAGAPGNSANGAAYAIDYNLINPGAELRLAAMGLPVAVFGELVTNASASTEKTGFIAGLKVGALKKSGDWWASYDYRSVQADSTVAAFSDADSFGGGTNGMSHRIAASYQIADGWAAALTGYLGETGIAAGQTGLRRNKLHADLVFKF